MIGVSSQAFFFHYRYISTRYSEVTPPQSVTPPAPQKKPFLRSDEAVLSATHMEQLISYVMEYTMENGPPNEDIVRQLREVNFDVPNHNSLADSVPSRKCYQRYSAVPDSYNTFQKSDTHSLPNFESLSLVLTPLINRFLFIPQCNTIVYRSIRSLIIFLSPPLFYTHSSVSLSRSRIVVFGSFVLQ
jgi:hypothetical protein